jgi:hypothetical protein
MRRVIQRFDNASAVSPRAITTKNSGERPAIAVAFMVAGRGFEPSTFGLCIARRRYLGLAGCFPQNRLSLLAVNHDMPIGGQKILELVVKP